MLLRPDFIKLLERTTDESWLSGMLSDPDSAKVLGAVMDEFSRVDAAGGRNGNAGLISMAPGGHPGVCDLTLTRTTTTNAGTVPKGYRFTAPNGIDYVTTADSPLLAGQATVVLHIESLRQSELVNTVDETWPDTLAGTLDEVSSNSPLVLDGGGLPLIGPPGTAIVSTLLLYGTSTPTTLGASDYLSAHGNERGQQRQEGEATETYRGRVRNIPETVSPAAIVSAVAGVVQHQSLPPATVYEPRDWSLQYPITDASNTPPIVITMDVSGVADHDHGMETGDLVRVRNVLGNLSANGIWRVTRIDGARVSLDASVGSGAFVSSPGANIEEYFEGLDYLQSVYADVDYFDDPTFGIVGLREAAAYFLVLSDSIPRDPDDLRPFFDGYTYFDDPVFGYCDITDHPVLLAGLLAIWEECNRKRAGGVQFDVGVPGPVSESDASSTTSASYVLAWTLTPPAGKVWLYWDGFFGHIPNPAGAAHYVEFDYDDATSGTSPAYSGPDSEHIAPGDLAGFGGGPMKRIISIKGYVKSDGATTVYLTGAVRVLEVTA